MNTTNKTSILVKTSLLAAIATIFSFLDIGLPIFPSFLKLDISDIPAVIGAIALGPIPAIFIELVKNLLHGVIGSTSMWVGELANFLIGSCLVVPIAFTMKNNKNTKNFIFGAIIGIILMAVSASVLNVYVLLPMYATVMNFPTDQVIAMSHAINPKINDLNGYILYIVVPFNLLKGVMVMLLSFFATKALPKQILMSK